MGAVLLLLLPLGCGGGDADVARASTALPKMRWDAQRPSDEAQAWTRATLGALQSHGADLEQIVPADITNYCPAYPNASVADRRAFWAGLFSALAKYESTWNPNAVGGGGRWFGLVQIAPGTARHYGCRATSGEALKDGSLNLSCAVRIAANTVARDGVVSSSGRGIAADWGPFHDPSKVADISAWTRAQSYCR